MERFFYKGLSVSGGVGMGKICVFRVEDYTINSKCLESAQIASEIIALEMAIAKTLKEINVLKYSLENNLERDGENILEVYKVVLEDDFFIQQIKKMICENKLYAEKAVDICFKSYLEELDESCNDYARQRVYDLKDIRARLIRNILGVSEPVFEKIYHKQIVAVKELTPTLAVMLGRKKVQGILAEEGAGFYSHAAIILRGLGIPALNNVNFANISKSQDQFSIIDGQVGILIVNPESLEIERYRNRVKENLKRQKEVIKKQKKPTKTLDGQRIHIFANVGNMEDCNLAKEKHADGIGLVRTELLFVGFSTILDEKAQFASYLKIVKKMRKKPVTFRTVDFGSGKTLNFAEERDSTTGMDLRGIAHSLQFREGFNAQIRSILNIARYGNVHLCFPMVSQATQIKEAKRIIQRLAAEEFHHGDKTFSRISIGAVIETREGVENLDEIIREVDFISIGTNDLFHHLKGMNRETSIMGEGEYLDPAFLKTINRCIEKVRKRRKQAMICGEMASDPLACVLLVGMGLHHLSMSPAKIVDVKSVLGSIRVSEAAHLLKKVLRLSQASEVKEEVSRWVSEQTGI